MKRAVIIFTRVPEPGKTKTRMMPHLSPVQCARLHTCFLKDIVMECRNGGADVFVSYTPEEGWKTLKNILGEVKGWIPQTGKHLGERMYGAMKEVLDQKYDSCLLIGADVPELEVKILKKRLMYLKQKM